MYPFSTDPPEQDQRHSYEYDDTSISGFIGTHQPAIWMGDYGYVTLMPQVGDLRTTPEPCPLGI